MDIEAMLEKPFWVIDLLPWQVPADSKGQFFAVERYFLQSTRREALLQKHLRLLLKLNCYLPLRWEDGPCNPAPEMLEKRLGEGRALLFLGKTLIVREPDDIYMTVYGPDAQTLELLRALAGTEGLFVWQPPQSDPERES